MRNHDWYMIGGMRPTGKISFTVEGRLDGLRKRCETRNEHNYKTSSEHG